MVRVRLVKCPGLEAAEMAPDASLATLLAHIARAAGRDTRDVSVLIKGKRLDSVRGAESLSALGIVDGVTAIVMIKSSAAAAVVNMHAATATARRESLDKAERAARVVSERLGHEGESVSGGAELELYNQNGKRIEVPDTDRRGLALGYLLHAKAKGMIARAQRALLGMEGSAADQAVLIQSLDAGGGAPLAGSGAGAGQGHAAGQDTAALVEDSRALLEAAHQAFDAVDARWLELGDNYALFLIDSAWAALLGDLCANSNASPPGRTDASAGALPAVAGVGDSAVGEGASSSAAGASPTSLHFTPTSLSEAGSRLSKAQKILAALHGPALEKLDRRGADGDMGHDAHGQARATYVRLRLLLGVIALHESRVPAARALLLSARDLCHQLTLTVDDDAKVAELLSLGFTRREACQSLLACAKDTQRAVAYALEVRDQWARVAEGSRRRREDGRTARRLGRTAAGQLLSTATLRELESMGFPRGAAIAALKRADNAPDAALALLTVDETRAELDLQVAREESEAAFLESRAEAIAQACGVPKRRALRMLQRHHGDEGLAQAALLRDGELAVADRPRHSPPPTADNDQAAASPGPGGAEAEAPGTAEADNGSRSLGEETEDESGDAQEDEVTRARREAEERLIDESGLVDDVRAAEAAYDTVDLRCEAAAIQLYLARLA
mmetsp:Transcript_15995/g.39286  ORF Transcript_15995/g.39286 Transcript_15995/m.39286 type:complete len:676 (+) Transcript_15995:79-2106(+)